MGLIFAIAFSSFLMAHQASIFAGIMDSTRSQILDITDADLWVMDGNTQYFDEVSARICWPRAALPKPPM